MSLLEIDERIFKYGPCAAAPSTDVPPVYPTSRSPEMRLATKIGAPLIKHDARFDPLLREESLLLRDEQWNRARAHRGDTDGDFGLGECRSAIESDHQGSSDPNDKPKSAGHISPPSAQQSLRM